MTKLLQALFLALMMLGAITPPSFAKNPDYSDLSTEALRAKAKAGDAHANYTIGHDLIFNLDTGEVKTENMEEALTFIRRADELGHDEAPSFLALYHYGQFGGEAKPKKAKAALMRGIERGGKGSKLNFVVRYSNSETLKESLLAKKLLVELSDDPESVKALAPELMQFYSFGDDATEPDLERGRKFAKLCSEEKREYAQCNFLYARYLQNGWGGDKDLTASTRYFKRAAEADDPRAQWNYGMALIQGNGTEINLEEAYSWVKKSAENDYLDGLLSFAVMNAIGQGTKIDNDLAYASYEKAAKRGSAHALRGMSLMMMEGQGTAKNEDLGLAALLVADENGEANARQLLGYLLQNSANLDAEIAQLRTQLAPQIAQIKSIYPTEPAP